MTTPTQHIAHLTTPADPRPLAAGDAVRILRGEYTGQAATVQSIDETFVTVEILPEGGKNKGKIEQYMLDEVTRTIAADADAQPEPEDPAARVNDLLTAVNIATHQLDTMREQLAAAEKRADANAQKAAAAEAQALKLETETDKARKALESEKAVNASMHRRIAALESAPAPQPVEPPTPKRWEIRTLVQHLTAPEKVAAADAELAAALNDGWLIVDVTVTPALGGAGMPKHYRVVTLKRRAAATPPTPPAKHANILAQVEAVLDSLDSLDDPADDDDTLHVDDEAAPAVIIVDSPNLTAAQNAYVKHQQEMAAVDDALNALTTDLGETVTTAAERIAADAEKYQAARQVIRDAAAANPNPSYRYSAPRA